jgi:Asp-tRNA(Asn)/Glu-tRNA(Gln) amidotransferase A subunit family amidase
VVEVRFPEWDEVTAHCAALLVAEAWKSDRHIVERDATGIGSDVVERLRLGDHVDAAARVAAGAARERWRRRLRDLFSEVDVLATPTLTIFPPLIEDGESLLLARATLPFNLAGVPALAIPVPATGGFPASLQLVGPERGEEALLAAGLVVEAAAAT